MTAGADYTRLGADQVLATIDRLHGRIGARFPGRNLAQVAAAVAQAARELRDRRPPTWLRVLRRASQVLILALLIAAPTAIAIAVIDGLANQARAVDWLGIGESAINDLVFVGIAILFLWALPQRIQRNRDLAVLNRLRSVAHVIDMHQLTKDPDRFLADYRETAATVDPGLDPTQMSHYLDYCSELLSLVGKIAALLAEDTSDAAVLSGVQGVEQLTTGLSRKIWQKIALLPHPDGDKRRQLPA